MFFRKRAQQRPEVPEIEGQPAGDKQCDLPDPLLKAICEDIISHPGDYSLRRVDSGSSTKATIFGANDQLEKVARTKISYGLSLGYPDKVINLYTLGTSNVSGPSDKLLIDRAIEAIVNHERDVKRADLARGLAEAQSRRSPELLTPNNLRSALHALFLDDTTEVQRGIISQAVDIAIPVIDGTHELIPVKRWIDKQGAPHRTRREMREANNA
ncbi:MAG: hypothetical protein J0H19_12535 [Rhodospirillales bacterium]|nr:hypothetical protein [Rhodospirillales bacterium]MBN8927438.1 hypothetical protein [Rhodospirillales bacterium]